VATVLREEPARYTRLDAERLGAHTEIGEHVPFPKFEEWQAPWEKSKTDFDAEKAKSLVYSLSKEIAETKERHATQLADVETERDTLKTKVEEHETKDLSEVERLKRENERLKDAQTQAKAKPDKSDLTVARLELALEHGLTKDQARRLIGETAEELAADAKVLVEQFGGQSAGAAGKPPSQKPAAKNLHSGLGDDGDDMDASTPAEALKLLSARR
jgi:hypothetical protein